MTKASLSLPAPRMAPPQKWHWPSALVLAVVMALNLFAGLSLASFDGGSASAKVNPVTLRDLQKPPEPEPLKFRDVAPLDALALNAAVPVSALPNPAAKPLAIKFASDADRVRSLQCLTAAVYYEAAIEPTDGQRAVAQVVLNRVRHPAYPRSICGVVFQGSERATGCQFTFTCDGSLRRTPSAAGWERARKVAEDALSGKVYKPVGWATHYHTNWVVPYWSSSLVKAANVGTHIFYRWTGGWGQAAAFRYRPNGVEPIVDMTGRSTGAPAIVADATDAAAAAAALNADTILPVQADISHRVVIRRYESLTREQATAAAIARTGEPASSSLRWALAGGTSGSTLGGKSDDATAASAKAASSAPERMPRCLAGVRRVGDKVQGPPEPGC